MTTASATPTCPVCGALVVLRLDGCKCPGCDRVVVGRRQRQDLLAAALPRTRATAQLRAAVRAHRRGSGARR